MSHSHRIGASAALALAIAAFDYLLPQGVVAAVAYIVVVLVASGHPERRVGLWAAVACSVLTAADLMWMEFVPPHDLWKAAVNRALAVATIWVTFAITDRVRRLAMEQERLAAFTRCSRGAIVGMDRQGRITDWNPAAERLYGRSAAAMVGQPHDLVVPPAEQARVQRLRQHLLEGRPVEAHQAERIAASGDAVPVAVSLAPIRSALGDVVGIAEEAFDLTSWRRQEEHFRLAVEASPSGMIMVDARGTILLVNSETERMFQYARGELIGQPVEMLVPERFRTQHPGHRAGFLTAPRARFMGGGRDLFGLRKDGSEMPIEIGLNPIETEEGILVLCAAVDITERKLAEQALRLTNGALQAKSEEMEQLVSTVSHDLRAPLVTSSGFLGVLREELREGNADGIADAVLRLERANQRMTRLIEDLLELSRLGRVADAKEDLDPGEIVARVASDLAPELDAAGATLVVAGPLPRLIADPLRLTQVLENLLRNAIRHACPEPGKTITIGGRTRAGATELCVRDQGPGIAREHHERIFRLFERLRSDGDGDGTGVGLAIVARIARTHGGRAWVESEPGEGATFWVSFPAGGAAAPAPASPATSST